MKMLPPIGYLLMTSFSLAPVATAQTRPAEAPPPTIVRVYDVRDLTAPVQNFPLSGSPYARALASPNGATNSQIYNVTSQAQLGQLPVSGARTMDAGEKTEQASIDELTKLIEDYIDYDTWKENGGRIGAIRAFHGLLVVTQTKEVHQRIVQLLEELARDEATMVRVDARWLLMSPADASKLTKSAGRDGLPTVDPALLDNPPAGTKHFTAQTVSRNGQTVYVISGLNRSLLTSAVPVVSTGVAAYALDLTNIGGGVALEINSRVNSQQNTASVTLYSVFSDPAQTSRNGLISIASVVTTQPAGAGQNTELPTASGLQPFSRVVQDMRTTVRVPLGVPVLVGGMTLQPESKGGDDQELLLILKVTASK